MSQGPATPPRAPLSTYRFQFNQHFSFAEATRLVPYLHRLGVCWLYASPYLQARPGSLHGYDISSHNRLNPEIGTVEEHTSLGRALRSHGMGHLLDIVPNHMGIGQADNEWWLDVLEHGPSSVYAPFFDIDWQPLKPELANKVLLPVLGDQFGRILEKGELKLVYAEGRFRIQYFEQIFPVAPKSSTLVLRDALQRLASRQKQDDHDHVELESIVTALEHLPPPADTDPRSVAERRRESVVSRRRIAALYDASPAFRAALDETLAEFNGRPGEPHSFDRLEQMLKQQSYRLAFWRVAAEEINYRRFFDINDLAGVRVERGEVFQATHRLILQLLAEGKVDGLRIDHPDGLFHPPRYLRELQHECARRNDQLPVYVVVEKILTGDEELPDDWPVSGTVGYEFLNRLNGLFVAGANERAMTEVYERFLGRALDLRELVYDKKRLILRVSLVSELNVLAYLLDRISEQNRLVRDFTLDSLRHALRETIACFPVYRTYIDAEAGRVSDRDQALVEQAVRAAMRRNPATSRTVFDFIRDTLLLRWPDSLDAPAREEHSRFVMKFQQLTGPVMAKGLEDTTFYIYNRLVSLNEVGGEPERFGVELEEFHSWVERRRARWPLSMNSTSTHDTKRSEDVRARINVLSEIPQQWEERVRRWAELNRALKQDSDVGALPDANDEYLFYQTLVGAWPLGEMEAEDRQKFVERMQQYMEKATREAKVHTSWINPNEEYDAALRDFVASALRNQAFLDDFVPFATRVTRIGMLNSLSQTAIKLTCPGVPDIYQGQEVWDFSLVDPDNRRPVDYEARSRMLESLQSRLESEDRGEVARSLLESWESGAPKLLLSHLALDLRRREPDLFIHGDYRPLRVQGPAAEHIVAFRREHAGRAIVVVAPRLWGTLLWERDGRLPEESPWSGASLVAEEGGLEGSWTSLLDGGTLEGDRSGDQSILPLDRILDAFPVAILERVTG